ncbi:MAG: hypothetical protein HZB42_14670 [Sphingobacteriales bacterium]|nr:hypothetical protein [Sphingobacteriales bacterium]
MRKLYFLLLTVFFAATISNAQNRVTNILVGASPFQDSMWTINIADYSIIRRLSPTLAGFTITGMNGIATNPLTGEHYIILKLSAVSGRVLAKVNVQTGVCTQIGNMGDNFSTLAFRSDGQLFGVTGDGATTPETMYTIDTLTGLPTFYRTLGNGLDGEVIAFNPDDSYFYHWSGNGTVVWERFQNNLDPIQPLTTPVNGEVFGALYAGGGNIWISNIASTIRYWNIPAQTADPVLINTPDDLRGLVRESCISSISAAGPTTVCTPATVPLVVNGGTGNYQWYLNGVAIPGETNSTYNATATGVYNCIYTDGCGVTDSASVGIDVVASVYVAADAGVDKTICASTGQVAMTGNAPVTGTGTWTQVAGPAATIVSPNSPTTNITGLTTPGTYTFQWTITNAPCPPSSDEVDVVVNPNPPTPAISGGNVTVCQGTTVTLSAPADPNYTYQWARHLATEPWVNMGTGQTQAVTTSGLYRVTVTNQFGCSTTSTDVYVNVADYVFNGSLGAGGPQQT